MIPSRCMKFTSLFGLVLAAIAGTAEAGAPSSIEDVAVCMNFQGPRGPGLTTDFFRGRMLLAGYLDDDEYTDFVFGNPGDQSFVARTVPSAKPGCAVELEVVQILSQDGIYWTGGLADTDNDGDLDLFIGAGGNENAEHNVYWKNMFVETGTLSFVDQTDVGATVIDAQGNTQIVSIARHSWDVDIDGNGTPGDEILATSGVNFADVNGDAWIDIFLSGNLSTPGPQSCKQPECGRNTLWLNNGDGTFRDVTEEAGLASGFHRTRHATFFDVDNDGDRDLFVNNYLGPNGIYQNNWLETGELTFTEVTTEVVAPGEDARYPWDSFGSRALDVNNDGIEDIMTATRAPRRDFIQTNGERQRVWVDCGGEEIAESQARAGQEGMLDSPYDERDHALFVSDPEGFKNRATEYGVNARLVPVGGVMGWQIGDLNADGVQDIIEVRGAPASGQDVYALLSDEDAAWGTVSYGNESTGLNALDIPRDPQVPGTLYDRWEPGEPVRLRGHGSVIVDVDNDGTLELLTSNGGATFPGGFGDVREVNRIYKFTWPTERSYFKLFLKGDGITVNRDAIGAKAAVKITDSSGSRTIFQSVYGTHAFSAQNGFELYYGLGDDPTVAVDRVTIFWPDGSVQFVESGLEPNSRLVVEYKIDPCTRPAACGLDRALIASPSPENIFQNNSNIEDEYLVGDWDGDGCDNLAVRRDNLLLMDTNYDGAHDLQITVGLGNAADEYLIGDWNGDGCDDIGVREGSTIAFESNFDGKIDFVVTTGPGNDADEYLVGDIEGIGMEAIAWRIGNQVTWDRMPWNGTEDGSTGYGGGKNEDQYLIGRWSNGGLAQTLAVRRDNVVLMNFDLDSAHDLEQTFGLGNLEDEYLVGDWDGDGLDNLAVRSGNVISMDQDFDSVVDRVQVFGGGTGE